MWNSATPPAPSQQELEALGKLLAASRQQKADALAERRMMMFYVVLGAAVFVIALAGGGSGDCRGHRARRAHHRPTARNHRGISRARGSIRASAMTERSCLPTKGK
jgi:Na+/H+ antiporter NhaC